MIFIVLPIQKSIWDLLENVLSCFKPLLVLWAALPTFHPLIGGMDVSQSCYPIPRCSSEMDMGFESGYTQSLSCAQEVEGQGRKGRHSVAMQERRSTPLLALNLEGGHKTRHAGSFQKPEKTRKWIHPRALRRKQLCQHLDFSSGRPISDFSPPELYDNKCVLLWAIRFVVICCNSCKKIISNGRSQLYMWGAWAWSRHQGTTTSWLQTPPWGNTEEPFLRHCSHDIQ